MTYPFVVASVVGDEAELPAMFEVRQHFDVLPAVDVLAALEDEWPRTKAPLSALAPGASVAVAVGSRGIADIAVLVRGIVERLSEAGCEPFVVPAMGSHGGATAAGQTEALAHLGVTEAAVGAPVRATMDVVALGEVEGTPSLSIASPGRPTASSWLRRRRPSWSTRRSGACRSTPRGTWCRPSRARRRAVVGPRRKGWYVA